MSIVGVKILTQRNGWLREKHARQYQLRYLVETSSSYDGPHVVLTAPSVPSVGDYYIAYGAGETDTGARCIEAVASHVEGDPKLWYVDCTFESAQREDPEDQDAQTPTDRKPTVSIRFQPHESRIYTKEPDGDEPAVNSLGEPFVPPLVRSETRMTLVLTRYDNVLNASYLMTLQDKLNSSYFSGAAPRTLKLNVTDVHEEFIEGARYWLKTYELAYEPNTWDLKVLDAGYKVDPATGNYREIVLDGEGNETAPTWGYYHTIQAYREMDFMNVAAIQPLAYGEAYF